jgi:Holliday junction resolvase RusA-like endonuclease
MKVSIETENCNRNSFYLFEESANSSIRIELNIPTIISRQSRKHVIDTFVNLIQIELNKFDWIIVGSVTVDFLWYLNAVERQETDKIGDLDNISKPIVDSLIGPKGILVDDSQIGGLYTYWQSRNNPMNDNILQIEIKFINDYVLNKKNLMFIQYSKAICLPVNLDISSINNIIAAKVLVKSRLRQRKVAERAKRFKANIDRYFVCSEFDFHRTRLNAFSTEQIISIEALNSLYCGLGITWRKVRQFFYSI